MDSPIYQYYERDLISSTTINLTQKRHLQTVKHVLSSVKKLNSDLEHTIHQTIIDRPILEECRGSERRRGSPPHLNWREQDMELDLDEEEGEDDGDDGFGMDDVLEALPAVAPAAPEVGLNFNMEEMLEALPAANGAFDMEMLAEVLPAVGGVSLPPPARRDPRERYMQRPDGR